MLSSEALADRMKIHVRPITRADDRVTHVRSCRQDGRARRTELRRVRPRHRAVADRVLDQEQNVRRAAAQVQKRKRAIPGQRHLMDVPVIEVEGHDRSIAIDLDGARDLPVVLGKIPADRHAAGVDSHAEETAAIHVGSRTEELHVTT